MWTVVPGSGDTKVKKVPHFPLAVITWEDHSSIDAWQGHEEAAKAATPKIITSCGWLHHETPKVYSIVATIADDSDVATQQIILKSAIIDFYLVPGSKSPKKRRNIPKAVVGEDKSGDGGKYILGPDDIPFNSA